MSPSPSSWHLARCVGVPLRCAIGSVLAAALTAAAPGASAEGQLKFGTIAPKGSLYHRVLQEVGQSWKQVVGRKARFSIYAGGTQGGELAMVKRMRIGQLDGAMLSTVGLDAIDTRVAALQFLPMAFRNWAEFDHVAATIRPDLEAALAKKGFVVFMWGEAGWVQWYTKVPVSRPDDFRHLKLFGWGGNPKSAAFYRDLGFTAVAIETNDILPALQTGLLDAVPLPAFYALAGQFDRVAPFMLNVRWVPIVGAAVMTKRTWNRLDDAEREALRSGAAAAGERLRAGRERLERDSITAMQGRGLSVHEPPPAVLAEWHALLDGIYPKLRDTLVPAEIFDRVFELLRDYRKRHGG